ncbi:MAG: bifunctional hydroxymethylpyrimidine kinase/phosphomethylpyrimidine kinase [Vicinamibacteraceae bacterium]|nr:bifunctional hydroxymethylpyrimidine kinase/phosphomethylpyrimidine kinase [Vicinamibacteraceae bacterium]
MTVCEPARARDLVARWTGRRLLVVGDVMLDHFVVGRVNRISPEAPVPVVEFDHETFRLGGAANVAANIRALGGEVTLVGLVGADGHAALVTRELEAHGIEHRLVTGADRPTTRKMRIVTTRNQQVARVDYEDDRDVNGGLERAIVEAATSAAAGTQAIVVSDYLKGVVTAGVMQALVAVSDRASRPLLVDPKIPHIDHYAGAHLVTPNHHEAEVATAVRVRTDEEARRAAHRFAERARCDSVLITRGEQGLWWTEGRRVGPEGRAVEQEGSLAAVAREVADVTGAGDTVIATIALALAAGAALGEAAWLANHAAGISVSRFGPTVVTPDELLSAL